MPPKNMIRLIFFADTHLGFDYPIKPRVNRRRRGPDFFNNFRRVLSYATETKADFVVHGGDLFFRSLVPHKIVDMVYADLFEFAKVGIPIFIVPGNHERSILPTSLFLNHPNIRIFHKPGTFKLDIGGTQIALSGFPCDRKEIRKSFRSLLEETGWKDHSATMKLLCIHQAVEGAQVGPSNYTFRWGSDVIRLADLPKDALAVLCGHIHRKQILRNQTNFVQNGIPVIYPGSTERTSFAEKLEEKGFFEIDFQSSPENGWQIDRLNFIKLPTRPMVDLYLESGLKEENLESFIWGRISTMDKDSIVRLKCSQDLDPQVRSLVTSRFLRELFPETMNFQFSANFFPR